MLWRSQQALRAPTDVQMMRGGEGGRCEEGLSDSVV